ncbi:hypothetical protein AVEN_83440-1 [Araneus ventricosus]|uniref:Uncharacterized protein n=1 Tax=Araneus ventricosus TaxID=182803 RepID=A0A4Y2RNB2_ARAVE|nr:hypothetical protein AVEN_83440-1 [Araneus ventricosus]
MSSTINWCTLDSALLKTLEGLYLTNDKNDYACHHAKGTTAPIIKEIKDEYLRHPLKTLSLYAHRRDFGTDEILKQSNFIAMSETKMYEDEVINEEGFELKAFVNNTLKSKNDRQERNASGVAIYGNLNSVVDCTPLHFTMHNKRRLQDIGSGNIRMTDITINGQSLVYYLLFTFIRE